ATGSMLLARWHAAAVTLKDGRILIAGGSTSSGPTSETELYNPATRSWTIGDSMLASRSGHTATLLADGRVLIAGGEGSGAPGNTLEIFNPDTGSFSAAGTLTTPRKNHAAVLLSDGSVMMVGGSAASAELYQAWNAAFIPTGSPANSRSGAAGAPLAADGLLLLAGGKTATAELYGFPTIKTDKDDYSPGVRAIITGGGWAPGETVTLVFVEVPQRHPDRFLKLTADASGNLYYDQWAPERHDVGVRFYVTAAGSLS